jgi:SNARE protein 1
MWKSLRIFKVENIFTNSVFDNCMILQVLDSAEQAVEGSLAATNHVNQRAHEIFSQSYKTGCWTWLIIFAMSLMFLLMVFLIRIT